MKEILERLFKGTTDEVVSWRDLNETKPYVWIDMHTGLPSTNKTVVAYMRILTAASGQLMYITRIKAGSGYHYHMHKDAKEKITALRGQVTVNNRNMLQPLQYKTFHAGTRHSVITQDRIDRSDYDYNLADETREGDAELVVEFTHVAIKPLF